MIQLCRNEKGTFLNVKRIWQPCLRESSYYVKIDIKQIYVACKKIHVTIDSSYITLKPCHESCWLMSNSDSDSDSGSEVIPI